MKKYKEESRVFAERIGATYYQSIWTCKNNHKAPLKRLTRNGSCYLCSLVRGKRYTDRLGWAKKEKLRKVTKKAIIKTMQGVVAPQIVGKPIQLPPFEPSLKERIANLRF